MFKVTSEKQFTHTVKVMVPVDGGHVEQSLKATFRVLPVDQINDATTLESQKELMQRAIVKLDDLVGDDDQPLPYSDDLRDQLIEVPYLRLALAKAYAAAVLKARAGN